MSYKTSNFKIKGKIIGVFLLFLTVVFQFLHLIPQYLILLTSLLSLSLLIFSVLLQDKEYILSLNKNNKRVRLIFIASMFLITIYFFAKI